MQPYSSDFTGPVRKNISKCLQTFTKGCVYGVYSTILRDIHPVVFISASWQEYISKYGHIRIKVNFVYLLKKKLMGIAISSKTIEKYFGFLLKLDNKSKKKLIIKLTESIEDKNMSKIKLKSLSGAWEDSRDSDEIIREIRESRMNKKNDIDF